MPYLTNRGVVVHKSKISPEELRKLRQDLTVSPTLAKQYNFKQIEYKIYEENTEKIYIPRFYAEKRGILYSLKYIPAGTDCPHVKFQGKLLPHQVEAVNAFFQHKSGILEIGTGGGKTVIALNIIATLQKKTIILVHKQALMHQWIERANQYVPNARIGIIQGAKCEIADRDIVICMLQTLCKKQTGINDFSEFGLCIVDEAHHIGSEVFTMALFKVNCAQMLALTATPQRRDQLHFVLDWFFNKIIYSKQTTFFGVVPQVNIVKFFGTGRGFKEVKNSIGELDFSNMITQLCQNSERNQFIISEICKIAQDPARFILVLSDRITHIQRLQSMMPCNIASGLYYGKMKKAELDASAANSQVLFAINGLIAEFFDLPKLNTLVVASPKSTQIKQMVGRILRKPHEIPPLIIDIGDQFSIFYAMTQKRKKFYTESKFVISYSRFPENEATAIAIREEEDKNKPWIISEEDLEMLDADEN